MSTITLNDGSRVPWLAFGTGTALYGQDASDFVKAAIENGITHLDGAQMYNNEDTLAAGIKASGKPRSELYITTKLKGLEPAQTATEALKVSLRKLNMDYVDLFLIHSPSPANKEGKLKALWDEMEEIHSQGLAKSIGVSNFRVEDLNVILDGAKVIPAVNQVGFSCRHSFQSHSARSSCILTFGKLLSQSTNSVKSAELSSLRMVAKLRLCGPSGDPLMPFSQPFVKDSRKLAVNLSLAGRC
jgi:diketogulonate reductase-like aldo/keto reductase